MLTYNSSRLNLFYLWDRHGRKVTLLEGHEYRVWGCIIMVSWIWVYTNHCIKERCGFSVWGYTNHCIKKRHGFRVWGYTNHCIKERHGLRWLGIHQSLYERCGFKGLGIYQSLYKGKMWIQGVGYIPIIVK